MSATHETIGEPILPGYGSEHLPAVLKIGDRVSVTFTPKEESEEPVTVTGTVERATTGDRIDGGIVEFTVSLDEPDDPDLWFVDGGEVVVRPRRLTVTDGPRGSSDFCVIGFDPRVSLI